MNNKKKIAPNLNYTQKGGSVYKCIAQSTAYSDHFVFQRVADGWTMEVVNPQLDESGRIEWDYSNGGYFRKTISYQPQKWDIAFIAGLY